MKLRYRIHAVALALATLLLLSGGLAPAAQARVDLCFSGFGRFHLQMGTASCTTDDSSRALAYGAGSAASAANGQRWLHGGCERR